MGIEREFWREFMLLSALSLLYPPVWCLLSMKHSLPYPIVFPTVSSTHPASHLLVLLWKNSGGDVCVFIYSTCMTLK